LIVHAVQEVISFIVMMIFAMGKRRRSAKRNQSRDVTVGLEIQYMRENIL
jgi:hypothetical protein